MARVKSIHRNIQRNYYEQHVVLLMIVLWCTFLR